MSSFLWSSIRVRELLVDICSFLVLDCREWSWITWTRNHVFHHDLAFSILIFFMVVLSTNYNWYKHQFNIPQVFQFPSKMEVHNSAFFLIIIRSGHLVEIRRFVCISKSQTSLCVSFSESKLGICSYGQTSIFLTISHGSLSPSILALSYILSVLIYWICLLCDLWFRLYQHMTYIFCFATSYRFSLWYGWSVCHCFKLLLAEIHLRLPFLTHIHILSCEMSLVRRLNHP